MQTKTPSYCEEQYINVLEREIREKDAIIDWLAFELETAVKLRISAQDWIKLAKEKTGINNHAQTR